MFDYYTMNAVFNGLCGFVADKPLDDPANPPGRLGVLLPEGSVTADKEKLPRHLPLLIIPRKNLFDAGGREPDFVFKRSGGEFQAVYQLGLMDIFLDLGDKVQSLEIDRTPVTDWVNPKKEEESSFFWVASLFKGEPR